MKLFLTIAANLVCAHALAASGEATYKAKCSTCHDAGLASAPRVGDKAEWARRNRQGTELLYQDAAARTKDVQRLDSKLIPKDLFIWD